jgi:hypothetical protein
MAGKYALYLPYKVLDSLSSGNVTDSEFREFIMGLAEYDKSGTFPASHTAGFTMMFELLRTDLDFAKAKYEDIVEKRRQAGKRGGAPKGNKNAVRNRGGGALEGNRNAAKKEAPDQNPEPEPAKQTQAKQAKQADNSTQITENRQEITGKRKQKKDIECCCGVSHTQQHRGVCETTNSQTINNHIVGKCERLFLHIWENLGEPFSSTYNIKNREYWNQWWDNNQYSEKQIYKALRNVKFAVDNGDYERRYISADPCRFLEGGMIGRGLTEEMENIWEWNHNGPDPNLKKLAGDE